MGARVIKIEQPGVGDYARYQFQGPGENPIFALTNGGKESIAVDLKPEAGKQFLRRLVERADVVIESFRPGVMDRLGLGYLALAERNPRLIFCAISGYGSGGPYADLAGHDLNYCAMAGLLDQVGTPETPVIPGVQIADLAGGSLQAVIGILAALYERTVTGRGQFIDISMFHGLRDLLPVPLAQIANGHDAGRVPGLLTGRYACYQIYACRDQRFVAVGALEPKFWANLCTALQCPDLIRDQFAAEPRQSEVIATLRALFASQDAAKWFSLLGSRDCCLTPVRTLTEATPDLSLANLGPAPSLGSATRAVARECGWPDSEINELFQQGVLG